MLVVNLKPAPSGYSEDELPARWAGVLMASVNGLLAKKLPCFGVNT